MSTTINYKIRQCSKCTRNTEYFCKSCPCDLCRQCTENHIHDLTTIDHDVVVYRNTLNFIPNQNSCVTHGSISYGLYCKNCQTPVCLFCLEHKEHRLLDVKTEYESKQKHLKEIIHTIKSVTLFQRSALKTKITADLKTCHTEFTEKMLRKATTTKDFIDYVQFDLMNNVLSVFDTKHRCLKQTIEMSINLARIQSYENMHVQSAMKPIHFLLSKNKHPRTKTFKNHTSKLLMSQAINKEMVTLLLTEIEVKQGGKRRRRVVNEDLLKLMPSPEIHQSLTVTDVDCCYHMSPVTSNLFWVSYIFKLILTDVSGETFYCRKDLYRDQFIHKSFFYGSHTVNKDGDLFFIDRELDIIKLSKDRKTMKIFLKWNYSTRRPYCVYFSAFTGDLLVGVYDRKSKIGEVNRYNHQTGQNTLTFKYENLDCIPHYITENNNGDVVVSDVALIAATDRQGRPRFHYTGCPSGPGLHTLGLSTDALSHILVCDGNTHTVQMIDKDGQFLSHLLIRPFGIFEPCSLSYDANTHRLWVGSFQNSKVCVYKYITRKIALNDEECELDVMFGSTPEVLTKTILCDTNSVGSLKTNHTTDEDTIQIVRFNHLISVTGEIEHHIADLSSSYNGSHTVNSESELIYISGDGNIKKLSKDMKTTTTFIEQSEPKKSTPQCVYWSSSTEELLIGMRCKVSRFNMNGQLTQTVQYDKTGKLEIYCNPNYITENNNGDIVVSDFGAVVVTNSLGEHRFSYTGHPSGSGLDPCGICTDALLHILLCDAATKTVHMLNKDGKFLSHLLALREQMDSPFSLSYDVNTNHLYVGSDSHNNNTVHVYKYITEQDEENELDVMFGSTPEVLTKNNSNVKKEKVTGKPFRRIEEGGWGKI
ncbi:uncharacterized protein LOC128172333 isoform X3 [Crassostrea angulata]|uniref:uncharacterized protein LOC128172333 isoform X3 n=1 Tax=Magallana angulata TaxID=2784310 RepID=UPI0022B19FB9|nr:uncharacterized protein LOC128172333 isoform X3 [Crassostrea angulata]